MTTLTAIGPQGWEQIANFGVCGLLVVLFSIGLRRALRTGPGALAVPLLQILKDGVDRC
jgi:hypothetical protein